MPDLADIHQALVEDYRESFEFAAGKLLAQPSWTLEATVVLMHLHNGAVTIGPVRSLPLKQQQQWPTEQAAQARTKVATDTCYIGESSKNALGTFDAVKQQAKDIDY